MFDKVSSSGLGALTLVGLALVPTPAAAQTCTEPSASSFRLTTLVPLGGDISEPKVGNDHNGPVGMAISKDEKVFTIGMKTGQVRVYIPGVSNNNTVLAGTIPTYFNTEDGMLGIELAHNFETTKWIYLFYSDPSTTAPNRAMELARFTWDSSAAPNSQLKNKKVILRFPREVGETHHAAGGMSMDKSGTLIIGTGDNVQPSTGNQNAGYGPVYYPTLATDAQKSSANSNDLRGKILRLRPLPFADTLTPTPGIGGTYEIPPGNLWEKINDPAFNPNWNANMDTLAKVRKEVFSMGHRNPYHPRVDNASGWIFWGEIGPDAANNSSTMGPMGHEEWNLATGPGFFGHPYCHGKNQPWNSRTAPSTALGTPYDCLLSGSSSLTPLRNVSPNNTGVKNLPKAIPAVVAYANSDNSGNGGGTGDGRFGSGGETIIGGPMYRYDPNLQSTRKFPPYYEGKIMYSDWARRQYRWMVLNPNGTLDTTAAAVRPFPAPTGMSGSFIDHEFGPMGDLYMLRYSDNGYNGEGNSGLFRIEYTGTYDNTCYQPFVATVGTPVPPAGLRPTVRRTLSPSLANGILTLPVGYRSVELYDLGGRKVWSYSRTAADRSEAVRVPRNVSAGLTHAKLVP